MQKNKLKNNIKKVILIIVVLNMIICMHNTTYAISSDSVINDMETFLTTEPTELEYELEHNRWHERQRLLNKTIIIVDTAFIIGIIIIICIFYIMIDVYKKNEKIKLYVLSLIGLSVCWGIVGAITGLWRITDLYFFRWVDYFIYCYNASFNINKYFFQE